MIPEFNISDWYWQKEGGAVYSSARKAEFPTDDADYQAWLKKGGVPTPYPKDAGGRESHLELLKVLKNAGLEVPDPAALIERDGIVFQIKFTKKEFLLWCGLENIVSLNAAIAAGNMVAKTVHDLLFVAEFIDVTDPATVQMVGLLATEAAENILDGGEVSRILAGRRYEQGGNNEAA